MLITFNWTSWSAILAGSVTALALAIIFYVFGLSMGLKSIHPKSDEPFSHVGKTFGIWSAVTVVVSLGGGAYMAGMLAANRGMEHGFLVWAVVTIVVACISCSAIYRAMKTIWHGILSLGTGAAGLAGGLGKGAGHVIGGSLGELRHLADKHLDAHKINDDLQGVLRDTEIETLQPEYLKDQFGEVKSDIKTMIRKLTFNPDKASEILNRFLDETKNRLDSLTADIDKPTAVKAIMKNRNIDQQEAEQMVDKAVQAYKHAVDKARTTLKDARAQVEEMKTHVKDMADKAREKADEITNRGAKAACAAGIALVLGAVISIFAGVPGVHSAAYWYTYAV